MSATSARPSRATELTETGQHRVQQAADYVRRYRWWILAGLITAAVMEVLDTTIINVSLPKMAGNLGATNEEIAWVSTSYILANVVVLPMTAFFTARFGRRNYLTFSILLFIIAPTLGPTLGGWITDNYTWNWCFFINIPIGILAAFLVTSFLHDPEGARR